eukprot:Nitzschia sp. Nitz4//scaffold139_size61406//50934//51644//NITZ4_006467-RA/size61406-processed-gene-0.87-mRNA-1//-1//CDS//3329535873//6768//frame0
MSPSTPQPENSGNNKEKTSWFSSWFENDYSLNEIRQLVNAIEGLQAYQDEATQSTFQDSFYKNSPFGEDFSSVLKEMESFLNDAGFKDIQDSDSSTPFGGFGTNNTTTHSWSSQSTSSPFMFGSSTSMRMQQDSKNGTRLEVTLPRRTTVEDLSVQVVQEHPCLIQWSGKLVNSSRRQQEEGLPFRDQMALGGYADCSRIQATFSASQNALVIQAPNVNTQTSSDSVRIVPVTERN